jgi:phosphoglycerate dehydrogenase-like enzyme
MPTPSSPDPERYPHELMQAAKRLTVGCSTIIGTEHIDVDAATELGIVIGFGATPENYLGVAEAVVMLAAAMIKRLPQKWAAMRREATGWRRRARWFAPPSA